MELPYYYNTGGRNKSSNKSSYKLPVIENGIRKEKTYDVLHTTCKEETAICYGTKVLGKSDISTETKKKLNKRGHRQLLGNCVSAGAHDYQTTKVCMYVCMVITYSRVWINRVRLPILLVVS